jgi:hypothetical protein
LLMCYVDASFAVHPNMRGHTGGGLTMGRGFPISTSTKQKLNTRSSTESELVGVSVSHGSHGGMGNNGRRRVST